MSQSFELAFKQFREETIAYIRSQAPVRTGDLKRSIRLEETKNGWAIVIDIWYMKYTEEAWTYNRRWGKTLPNPREKWLQKSVERLALAFANKMKGVVVRVK